MGRICVTIPDSTEEELRRAAEIAGVTLSAQVCAMIDQYLRTPDHDVITTGTISDHERAAMQERLSACQQDLHWCRAELAASHMHLSEALARIPAPVALVTDGKARPSWWDRFMGRG